MNDYQGVNRLENVVMTSPDRWVSGWLGLNCKRKGGNWWQMSKNEQKWLKTQKSLKIIENGEEMENMIDSQNYKVDYFSKSKR